MVDFPQPDSPTSPNVSPLLTKKVTSLTACSDFPFSTWKYFFKSNTSKSFSAIIISPLLLASSVWRHKVLFHTSYLLKKSLLLPFLFAAHGSSCRFHNKCQHDAVFLCPLHKQRRADHLAVIDHLRFLFPMRFGLMYLSRFDNHLLYVLHMQGLSNHSQMHSSRPRSMPSRRKILLLGRLPFRPPIVPFLFLTGKYVPDLLAENDCHAVLSLQFC